MQIDEILRAASVIPVLEVADIAAAAPLAKALAAGGLRVVELTLRTACALEALGVMRETAPELIVGMGTVRTEEDMVRSLEGGAAFLVSPGADAGLLAALARSGAPALPGVATASEAMTVAAAGLRAMKFFPAEPAGGLSYLKSLAGPLPDLVFCPTGGVSAERAPDYLALPNVACVGGSWIATRAMIQNCDWDSVTENARRAEAMKTA